MSDSPSLRLHYVTGAATADAGEAAVRIVYGRRTEAIRDGLRIALPPVGGALSEIWSSDGVQRRGAHGPFRYVRLRGDLLFGYAAVAEESGLQGTVRRVYRELLALARAQGCPYPVRIWNHFPAILAAQDGIGRYQRFCAGRREAIRADARARDFPAPAVTTTGTCAEGLAVYFLASGQAGRALQNPRQVPPSEYPKHYGPHGHSFCRGVAHEASATLYLSGTASITGFETRHRGDAAEQAREALRNQAAVIAQAHPAPEALAVLPFVKTYLADAAQAGAVRAALGEALGGGTAVHVLRSALCRDDLQLELESCCALRA